jgi:hypothetical protein
MIILCSITAAELFIKPGSQVGAWGRWAIVITMPWGSHWRRPQVSAARRLAWLC